MHKRTIITVLFIACALTGLRAEVKYMTTADFKQKVFDYSQEKEWKYKGKRPCVIDFYTTWCGPCKRLAPIMEELSKEYHGKIDFYKVDTEQEQELSYVFQIHSIPQVLFIPVDGKPTMMQGLHPKEDIVKALDDTLKK